MVYGDVLVNSRTLFHHFIHPFQHMCDVQCAICDVPAHVEVSVSGPTLSLLSATTDTPPMLPTPL